MNPIINTETILSARDFLLQELAKPDIDLGAMEVYSMVHPSKDLPKTFIVVKTVGRLYDIGNVDVDGTLEFCIYAQNKNLGDDQTRPDLSTINNLTKKILPILQDAVFGSTSITSISQTIVSHSEIRYFYNSLVCETINLKS